LPPVAIDGGSAPSRGSGILLFGALDADTPLTHNAIRTLKAGFTQSDYTIHR
jgi:hypothetical protein